MTRYSDNITSGYILPTSAVSQFGNVRYTRSFRFTGGGSQTQQFMIPTATRNLCSKLYVMAAGSAATSDKITVSGGGNDYVTLTSFGSSTALDVVVRRTTGTVITINYDTSACQNFSMTQETTANVTLLSTDTATDYLFVLMYSRDEGF